VVGQGRSFELCATFELSSSDLTNAIQPLPIYSPDQVNWTHPAGHYCFSLEVNVNQLK